MTPGSNLKNIIRILVSGVLLFSWYPALGHANLLGNFEATISGSSLDIKVSLPENRVLNDAGLFDKYTKENLKLKNNGQECVPENINFAPGLPSVISMRVLCPEEIGRLEIFSSYFADAGYALSATVLRGGDVRTFMFSDTDQNAEFIFAKMESPASPSPAVENQDLIRTVKQFIWLGMKHIYTGYDHMLFVLVLILAVYEIKNLLKIITAFTIAHTITLVLSVLELVYVSPLLVEPLIALSISYVALEDAVNNWRGKKIASRRWHAAFGFGLIHGLGFAGVLREINLSKAILAPALLSFNAGVEIGQLTVLAASIPVLYLMRKSSWNSKIIYFASIIIGLLGIAWFFQRIFWG